MSQESTQRPWQLVLFFSLAVAPLLVVLGASLKPEWGVWSYLFSGFILAPVILYVLFPRFRAPTVSVYLPFVFMGWMLVVYRVGYVPQVARQLDAIQQRCVDLHKTPAWTCDDKLTAGDEVSFTSPDLRSALVRASSIKDVEQRADQRIEATRAIDSIFGIKAEPSGDAEGDKPKQEEESHVWLMRRILPGCALAIFYQWLFLASLSSGLYFALSSVQSNKSNHTGLGFMAFSGKAPPAEDQLVIVRDFFYYALFAVTCSISVALVYAPTGVSAALAGEVVTSVDLSGEGPLWAWIDLMTKATPLVYAAIGYLMYAVTNVGLAVGSQNVSSLTFLRLGRRGVLVMLIGVALTGLAGDTAASNALTATPHLFALLAGLVPGVAISRLTATISSQDADSLGRVPGLAMFTRGALREAGVESLTDLAYADVPRLVTQTGLRKQVLRILVDRAILLDRIPVETQTAFSQLGIQHATDLVQAVSLPDTLKAVADNVKAQILAHPNWPTVSAPEADATATPSPTQPTT